MQRALVLLRHPTLLYAAMWVCVAVACAGSALVVLSNYSELAALDAALGEAQGAQAALEAAARALIDRAAGLQAKVKELQGRRIKLRQARRDVAAARDVARMPAAQALANKVSAELASIKEIVATGLRGAVKVPNQKGSS